MPNSTTARLNLDKIDPAIALEVRALHNLRLGWNWVCLLYLFIWVASAFLMAKYPHWWAQIPGVIAIGVSIQALAILMHEALHGNFFRHKTFDRWAAFAFGIPAFFSGTAYRVAHLNHHRNTRTDKDQDEISYLVRTPEQYRILFYAWFFAGTLFYFLIVPWKAIKIASAPIRREIIFEYMIIFLVYSSIISLAIATNHIEELFWYWLIPAQVAMLFSNVRGISEHLGTDFGSALTRTRTTTSNAFVSFLMLNLNYHLEHHLFPGIPWYNLKKLTDHLHQFMNRTMLI